MMFWKKDKVIELNCYTDRADVYNYFPIQKANKFIPQWFKKLPRPNVSGIDDDFKTIEESNLKECVGFTNYFSKGFILPLWSDLLLEIYEKGNPYYKWAYSDGESKLTIHGERSNGKHFLDTEYQHLKLDSPWSFRCSESIQFLALEPEWYFDKLQNIHILNGVLDFNTNSGTNVNMYIKRQQNHQKILLSSGLPIYHFVPLTEKKIDLKVHLVSKEKKQLLHQKNSRISFNRHFEKKQKILNEAKCPFKFDVES